VYLLKKPVQVLLSKADVYEVIEAMFLADPIEMLSDLLRSIFQPEEVVDGVAKWAEKATSGQKMQLVEKLIGQENEDWVAAVRADERDEVLRTLRALNLFSSEHEETLRAAHGW
tara:strand:- start:339 stop:680 length:342 start_codon:yes stop_codon:yes gene_type:complete